MSLATGYTVYFNLKNKHCGHLFQGRFGAKLVEGDSYLLSLTRYVHLNPVFIAAVKKLPLKDRLARLNAWRWSSYQGYFDQTRALKFVEYGPVLAMVDGRGRAVASKKYKEFVEAGVAQSDDEFIKIKDASAHTIGSLSFDCRIRKLYKELMEERSNLEDVAFRNQIEPLTKECVVEVVCSVLGVEANVVYTRQRDSLVRPVVAQMLCKFAGMTQRDVAGELNLKSGVAVSCQLRKLHKVLAEDEALKAQLDEISEKLHRMVSGLNLI